MATQFLCVEGVKHLLEAAIRGSTYLAGVTKFNLHLMTNSSTDGTPPTSTWATTAFTEITGTGYAAKTIAKSTSAWPVSQVSTDGTKSWEVSSTAHQWRGSTANDWDVARSALLTSTAGAITVGKETPIAWGQFSAGRDLTSTGDTLDVTAIVQVKTT